MKSQNIQPLRIDKTALSVVHQFDNSDEKYFWKSRTPEERLLQIDILRRMNYGDKATCRLQRVLEIAQR